MSTKNYIEAQHENLAAIVDRLLVEDESSHTSLLEEDLGHLLDYRPGTESTTHEYITSIFGHSHLLATEYSERSPDSKDEIYFAKRADDFKEWAAEAGREFISLSKLHYLQLGQVVGRIGEQEGLAVRDWSPLVTAKKDEREQIYSEVLEETCAALEPRDPEQPAQPV